MAFKGKTLFSWRLLNVMNPDSPFDTTHGKARLIRKGCNTTSLVLEWRILSHYFARLSADIVGIDLAIGCSDHHAISTNVEGMDTFRHFKCACRLTRSLTRIPKLELFIPPAADDHVGVWKKAYRLDGSIVTANLLCHFLRRTLQLPHSNRLIASTREYNTAIRRKCSRQYRSLSFMTCHGFSLCLNTTTLFGNLPTTNTAVPVGGDQVICRRTPAQRRNPIASWLWNIAVFRRNS
mmetsp:Transcript_6815/g.12491  ORF Transcript_6815/g.12491 Transcript_6815/m.12491 type:complete len:236 (+) Transcript_6815:3705-4412(+)